MRSLLRHPAVHFLVAGAAIFAATRWIPAPRTGQAERHLIVIGAAQIAQLRAQHLARDGGRPTEEETAALIEASAIDEMLYREALARGLDVTDAVVERRLVQDMRFIGGSAEGDDSLLLRQAHALGLRDGDPVVRRRLIQRMRSLLVHEANLRSPTRADLVSYFENHRDLFTETPQVALSQIFFAGADATRRARTVLDELKATRAGTDAAVGHGDPFISGTHLPLQSERALAKMFGPELASKAQSLPVGEWCGPLESTFGVHLLWVREKRAARIAKFDAVRDAVKQRFEAERAEAALRDRIAELRKVYRIEADRENG